MKKTLKLNEEQLHRFLAECVAKVLNEIGDTDKFYNLVGKSAGEATANGDISKAGRACRIQNNLARHNGMDPTDDKAMLPFSNGFNAGYGKKKIAESRVRRIVSECIAQEMNAGLEETNGKWGMGSMSSDLDALKDKRDNMSVYDSRYEELCDKIDRMEEMLQRIINAQKGGLRPVAESKKRKGAVMNEDADAIKQQGRDLLYSVYPEYGPQIEEFLEYGLYTPTAGESLNVSSFEKFMENNNYFPL